MKHLMSRQVHLDFHTSPLIENIGGCFSREKFINALRVGHVNSITVFGKCHHGLCYYPTKVGCMHPNLKFDLLGEQIAAAHEAGARAPVYITAGWSAHDAQERPEWRAKNKDGSYCTNGYDFNAKPDDARPFCSWITMCLNDGSYAKHIYDITREVCERYGELDGLFYDIVFTCHACYCDECVAGMKKEGYDPENDDDAHRYYVNKHRDFIRKCGEILHSYHPDATVFFNSGGAELYLPEYHFASTHYEMEDLPTAWGGYDKMPIRASFFSKSGKDYLGMTGKFHLTWGEFGGFKFGNALKFEAASMMAYGARCSIGDQLHPDGEPDAETYKNIGEAYEYVEKTESYCLDGERLPAVGIYLSGSGQSDEGLARMLLENQIEFGVVRDNDFLNYKAVIFPDCACIPQSAEEMLRDYIKNGGKVLFTGDSLIKDGNFVIDAGIKYAGNYGYDKDYIIAGDTVSHGIVKTPLLCYTTGRAVELCGAEVLAHIAQPYFARTYARYCSHGNTPYNKADTNSPDVTKFGNVVYMSHRICEMYYCYGSLYHKRYFINALNTLGIALPLRVSLGSSGRATLILQKEHSRYCVNLLYATPVKRGCAEVIEDIPDIYNTKVQIAVPEKIKAVTDIISGKELDFTYDGDNCVFTVPRFNCHTLITLKY